MLCRERLETFLHLEATVEEWRVRPWALDWDPVGCGHVAGRPQGLVHSVAVSWWVAIGTRASRPQGIDHISGLFLVGCDWCFFQRLHARPPDSIFLE